MTSKFHVQRCSQRRDGKYRIVYRDASGTSLEATSEIAFSEGETFVLEADGSARAVEVRG